MMAERTDLVKARREVEHNLFKTIAQLSATLIVLIAGFITQSSVPIDYNLFPILTVSVLALALALIFGLAEQSCSSKAYQAQQVLVENFYTKQIHAFSEPRANTWVLGEVRLLRLDLS